MKENTPSYPVAPSKATPYVFLINNQPTTTSNAIAHAFDKKHKNVLRDIKLLNIPEDFNRLNFEPVDYIDQKGEKRLMYHITKNGFMFLVMGFTGAKANRMKIQFINEFDRLLAEKVRQAQEAAMEPVRDPAKLSGFSAGVHRGLMFGEVMRRYKLSKDDVARIFHLRGLGLSQRETALIFEISRGEIQAIEKELAAIGLDVPKVGSGQAKMLQIRRNMDRVLGLGNSEQSSLPKPVGGGSAKRPAKCLPATSACLIDLSDVIEPGEEGFTGSTWRAA